MKAEYEDLELERWLRARERNEIVWTTKSGKEIPINQMSDSHLENAIKHLERKMEDIELTGDFDVS